jgi:hypothetical protein
MYFTIYLKAFALNQCYLRQFFIIVKKNSDGTPFQYKKYKYEMDINKDRTGCSFALLNSKKRSISE